MPAEASSPSGWTPRRVVPGIGVLVPILALFACGVGRLSAQQTEGRPPTGDSTGRGDPAARDTAVVYRLGDVLVEGRSDNLTGIATSASQGWVGAGDLRRRPLSREGEILESVPGVIMTQHSGDGKSNQMFARGFNLDHGTDFQTRVEGIPVNIASHAHGQGYTDLNFLIPELVDHVEYRLGTYYADLGDFGSAGGAHIRLARALPSPLLSIGVGANGFRRVVAAGSLRTGTRVGAGARAGTGAAAGAGGTLLYGLELRGYDGPWEVPQKLRKVSGMLRWSRPLGGGTLSLLGLGYGNRWNSSDQIPLRLIREGRVGRFGQVDPTIGGSTHRYSASADWVRSTPSGGGQRLEVHVVHYALDLFGNFTYLLGDPELGDQVKQEEPGRWTSGLNFMHVQPFRLAGVDHRLTSGVQSRFDRARVGIQRTRERRILERVREDDLGQAAVGVHAEVETRWSRSFRSVVGLRADGYAFDVESDLPANSGTARDAILAPKLSLIYTGRSGLELYGGAGIGFHSNDARGTTLRFDPGSGEAADPVPLLVPSRGGEVGARFSPGSKIRSTLTLWTVALDSELLFIGDSGTTEAREGSRRVGFSTTNFVQWTPEVRADLDLSFARARFAGAEPGQDRVPGALEEVITAGISREPLANGWTGALRLRHMGPASLVEDNSVRSEPTTLVNASLGWRQTRFRIEFALLNLLDARDADITYFYASRVAGDPPEGVEDLHIHPVEPRQLRVTARWGG